MCITFVFKQCEYINDIHVYAIQIYEKRDFAWQLLPNEICDVICMNIPWKKREWILCLVFKSGKVV
jgi:hypothetical protein